MKTPFDPRGARTTARGILHRELIKNRLRFSSDRRARTKHAVHLGATRVSQSHKTGLLLFFASLST